MEYRYGIGGGYEGVLRFDGRVIEFFNLFNGGTRRFLHPETRIERGEPNRKGKVTYNFWSGEHIICEFPVEAEWVPGFDAWVAGLPPDPASPAP